MKRAAILACTLLLWHAAQAGPCPAHCTCNKSKKHVTCSGSLRYIPEGLPAYAQDLSLKGNRIQWIRIGDLAGLGNVVNLLLNGNEITGVESGSFGSLNRVKLLNLRTNNLTSLDAGMFDGLPKTLKTLYLHENQISNIEEGVFSPLAKAAIQVLSLKMNRLGEIKNGDFEGLEKLKNLILDDNLLQMITAEGLNLLRNIRRMSLDNNRLTEFPTGVHLPLLSTLSLANNKLTSLNNGIFSGMARLTHINVSFNQINAIGETVFDGLTKLSTLDLTSNRLVTLSGSGLGKQLTNLLLDANLWHCDCGIQNMRRWIETTDYDVTCGSPPNRAGQSLKSLTIEDLLCQAQPSETKTKTATTSMPSTTGATHVGKPVSTGSGQFFCPDKCVCAMDVRHINCNRRGYTTVPSKLPDTTALLDLRDNKIRKLESNTILCPQVISLHLQRNGLQRIESGAFRHLSKLVYLYLNRNQISEIESGAFEGLESLSYLFLDHNRIAAIPSGLFRPLASIYAIYLRRNYLAALRSDSMLGLERLRWLYLTGNRLAHIDDDAFKTCLSLQRLYLGGNEISAFPSKALKDLGLLNHLDLSRNFIDVIPASLFRWMTQIQFLDLSSNQIHAVEGGFLDKLLDLKTLNVSDNLLRHLPELPPAVTEVKLANNTWSCDCKIAVLYKWVKAHQSHAVTCAAPANRVGRYLSSFQLSDLDCSAAKPKAESRVPTTKASKERPRKKHVRAKTRRNRGGGPRSG